MACPSDLMSSKPSACSQGAILRPTIIVDLMARGPLNELLPKTSLRWRHDSPRRVKVGFLNKEPPARLEPARHPADNRAAFGKMVQNRADCDKVERRTWRFVMHIKFPHFEIAA